MTEDAQLLRRYATTRSEAAFAEFVRRNLPLVYSAALRRLGGDAHRAEDVAQQVFSAVARDARQLSQHTVLAGWLHAATRNAAVDTIRSEQRRRHREQEAHLMHEISTDPGASADWSRLRPLLDLALDELGRDDREAVLLRFFQGRPFAEIGRALDLSEDAARKRVERSLDKLRAVLQRRGVASTSFALAALLGTEAIAATPAALATTITGAALASGTAATSAAAFLGLTKLQAGLAAVVLAGGTAGLITQQVALSSLREQTAATTQQVAQLTAANTALARTRDQSVAEVAALRAQLALQQTPPPAPRPSAPTTSTARPSSSPATTFTSPPPAASSTRNPTSPESAKPAQQLASMRRRYAPMFAHLGLTAEQGERFIALKLRQFEINQDLQDSVRDLNVPGNAAKVEALRAQFSAPVTRELTELLGPEGMKYYGKFEGSSFQRQVVVEPLNDALTRAHAPLTDAQMDQLVPLAAAHDHPYRAKPTDIYTTSQFDWPAFARQAEPLLTPAQLPAFRAHIADRQHQDSRAK